MFRVLAVFCMSFTAALAVANSEMKLEGECTGVYHDGTPVALNYFSDFEGCSINSKAAVTFPSDTHSAYVRGKRIIQYSHDVYSFKRAASGNLGKEFWLLFSDTTGNKHGQYKYRDMSGKLQSVNLECNIRDYEYAECLL